MEYLPCFYAFGCCMAFCVALHVRGAAMFWTSLGGALGWFVYVLCAPLQNDILQYFFGTLALAVYRGGDGARAPFSGHGISACRASSHGAGRRHLLHDGIRHRREHGNVSGNGWMHTLGIAGALALGILVVSTLARIVALVAEERRERRAGRAG